MINDNLGLLLRCPFCGGEPEVVRKGTSRQSHIISCTECGCTLETNETGDFCGGQWNNRIGNNGADKLKIKLYRLYPREDTIVDGTANEFIIAAETSNRARELANLDYGLEGPIWTDAKKTACELLNPKVEDVIIKEYRY
ncbi:MAG TPA: Lar family restriction alleviation protein [Desulfosporosinus sp.]|nr:Lar family restriction alleviation protein [Desulfosporosinus sp.]